MAYSRARRSYRKASAGRGRSAVRRAGRARRFNKSGNGRGSVLRIVVEQPATNIVQRPDGVLMTPAATRKARF